MLHFAARSGNNKCIKTLLSRYPVSERPQVVSLQDRYGKTVLHYAVASENPESSECTKTILALYPESERLQFLTSLRDQDDKTVLHCAAIVNNAEWP